MKKIVFLLFTFSLFLFLPVLGQLSPVSINPEGLSSPQLKGQGTEFFCTPDAFYGQDPNTFEAYFSDIINQSGYRCWENFSNISGDIVTIDWWGATLCPENPKSFEISFYEDNAGNVGNLVSSFSGIVTGFPTGNYVFGHLIHKYSFTLPTPVSGLSNGWVSIFGNSPSSSCDFAWSLSSGGDGQLYHTNGFYQEDLAFCLYTDNPQIPISNWAIFLGVFLIAGFTIFRFRRRIA